VVDAAVVVVVVVLVVVVVVLAPKGKGMVQEADPMTIFSCFGTKVKRKIHIILEKTAKTSKKQRKFVSFISNISQQN